MSFGPADAVAKALLYEGYALYPYRASSMKNRYRFTFGVVHPRATADSARGESSALSTECLLKGGNEASIEVRVRFLQPARYPAEPTPDAWGGAIEREIRAAPERLPALLEHPRTLSFSFPPQEHAEGPVIVHTEMLAIACELRATALRADLFKIAVRVDNLTPLLPGAPSYVPDPSGVGSRCLVSTHIVIQARGGELLSLLDPPEDCRGAAAGCRQAGVFPALVGEPDRRDTALASPIVLYDYPRIAPESPGDLFDATEIDEILSLRILTLTDEEKEAMRALDPRTKRLLERTEGLQPDDLRRLHGAVRSLHLVNDPIFDAPRPDRVQVGAFGLRAGSRVRLAPRRRADAIDLLLNGKEATVSSIEVDVEGDIQLAVTIDDDPGRDLGALGLPGHRFFFRPDEVVPL